MGVDVMVHKKIGAAKLKIAARMDVRQWQIAARMDVTVVEAEKEMTGSISIYNTSIEDV
jgi:hypothetical protein